MRWLGRTVLVAVVAGLCLGGPAGCGWLGERLAARALHRSTVIDGSLAVSRVGLFTLRAGPVRLDGDGWTVDVASLTVRYTPLGLLWRTIEAVEAEGMRIAVTGGVGGRAAGDAWRDINPAEWLDAAFAAARPWRVERVALGTVRCVGGAPVAWRLEGAVSGNLATSNDITTASITFSSLKTMSAGADGLRASGELTFATEASACGEGARGQLDGNLLITSQRGPLAGVTAGLTFTSLQGEWGTEGTILGNAFTIPSGDESVASAAVALSGMVSAMGTTLRMSDFALAGVATADALFLGAESVWRVPQVEGRITLSGQAGELPQLAGYLTLPRVTGVLPTAGIEVAAEATVVGVWPFDCLAGSVTSRVVRVGNAETEAHKPIAGDMQWRVTGLTNGPSTATWHAVGAVCLDPVAVRPFSAPLMLAQDVVCDFHASGSGTAGEAEVRVRGAPSWHCDITGGAVSGHLGRVEGRLTVGGGALQASVTGIVDRVAATAGALVLDGGDVRVMADAALDLAGSSSLRWQAQCEVGAQRLALTHAAVALDGLRATCKLRGDGVAVNAVEDTALAWSSLSAYGSAWQPGQMRVVVTGGVVEAAVELLLHESALRAEIALTLPLVSGGEIGARVQVPETALVSGDALYRMLPLALTLDVTGGTVAATAAVTMRVGGAVAVQGEARVNELSVRGDGGLWEVAGLDVDASFSGSAPDAWTAAGRIDVAHATAGKLVATQAEVLWRADVDEIFIERAQAEWCGGVVRVFAVHADAKRRSADLTLFIDQVQLGEILSLIRAVPGTGEGSLYGRLPLRYEQDGLRLSDGFLYSLPGEGGHVRLHDTTLIEKTLKTSIRQFASKW